MCSAVLALASITKHYRLGSLNNRNLFIYLRKLGSPRSSCWLIWFPREGSFLGLLLATFSPCLHTGGEVREEASSLVSGLNKGTHPIMRAPLSGLPLAQSTSQSLPSLNTSTVRGAASPCEFGRDTIESTAVPLFIDSEVTITWHVISENRSNRLPLN